MFVCMAPASWATRTALATKRDAYVIRQMTTHWPCDDVGVMARTLPSYAARELRPLEKLPVVAQSVEAKRLVGVLPYPPAQDLDERAREQSLLEQRPQWHADFLPDELGDTGKGWLEGSRRLTLLLVCGTVAVSLLAASCVFTSSL